MYGAKSRSGCNPTIRIDRALGDNIVATAGLRDVHAHTGHRFNLITRYPAVWFNHPAVDRVLLTADQVCNSTRLDYVAAARRANELGVHFTRGYAQCMNEVLKVDCPFTDLRPCLFRQSDLGLLVEPPYWVIMAGGKKDFETKQWDPANFQQLINFAPRLKFVAVGATPLANERNLFDNVPLRRVVDLVGKTSVNQLLQLIAHCEGVVCGVTSAMHIAAAFNKPCYVIAGGREPWWWEAYTRESWERSCTAGPPPDFVEHTYFHTVGSDLNCCEHGGCGRPHVEPVNADPNLVCKLPVVGPSRAAAQCLQQTSAGHVASAILADRRGLVVCADPPKRVYTIYVCLSGGDPEHQFESRADRTPYSYAGLHRRTLDSLIARTPADRYRLFIGCNGIGRESMEYVQGLAAEHSNIRLFVEPLNIGKPSLMRRMFAEDRRDTQTVIGHPWGSKEVANSRLRMLCASWVWRNVRVAPATDWCIWLDDDTRVDDGRWLHTLDRLIEGAPDVAYAGYPYVQSVSDDEWKWITEQPWYRAIPSRVDARGRPEVAFATGAFWAIRSDVVQALNWPPPIVQTNDDLLLGEAVRQNGYRLTRIPDMLVLVDDVQTRGKRFEVTFCDRQETGGMQAITRARDLYVDEQRSVCAGPYV